MATQHRVIRIEIAVDPIEYAEAHGVDVWAALDHAAERVVAGAQAIGTTRKGITSVERASFADGFTRGDA